MTNGKWNTPPTGDSILADVQQTIATLQAQRKFEPSIAYVSDAVIKSQGGNPEDFPQLEGYPGVRVIHAQGTL